jgi:hypothetical protein
MAIIIRSVLIQVLITLLITLHAATGLAADAPPQAKRSPMKPDLACLQEIDKASRLCDSITNEAAKNMIQCLSPDCRIQFDTKLNKRIAPDAACQEELKNISSTPCYKTFLETATHCIQNNLSPDCSAQVESSTKNFFARSTSCSEATQRYIDKIRTHCGYPKGKPDEACFERYRSEVKEACGEE